MSFGVINPDTRAAWQSLADQCSQERPSAGRRVRITGGKKYRGREGVVRRHQLSRYVDPFRYASEAQQHLRAMQGRFGYVCLIADDSGATFWVNAEHTEVLP